MFAATRGAMISRLLLIGACVLVTVGAQSSCSSTNGAGIVEIHDSDPGTGTRSGPTFSVTLALRDSSGRVTDRFARGELITFELTVRNRTNAPLRLQLPTLGGNQDFQVYKAGARDAEWDWQANKSFATVVTEVDFDARGSQVFGGTWDQVTPDGGMLAPGNYAASGRFFVVPGQDPALTDDDTHSPRVRFTVD